MNVHFLSHVNSLLSVGFALYLSATGSMFDGITSMLFSSSQAKTLGDFGGGISRAEY